MRGPFQVFNTVRDSNFQVISRRHIHTYGTRIRRRCNLSRKMYVCMYVSVPCYWSGPGVWIHMHGRVLRTVGSDPMGMGRRRGLRLVKFLSGGSAAACSDQTDSAGGSTSSEKVARPVGLRISPVLFLRRRQNCTAVRSVSRNNTSVRQKQ